LAALCVLAAAPGCARHHYYYAQTLPYELQAKPVENAQTIDLSRLAVAGNSTEAIDSEDVLEVSIVAGLGTNDTLTVPVRILENGSGHIPGVGLIPLAGLDLQSAEAVIAAAVVQNGLYRSPHVTVTMKKQRMCRVTVLGGVRQQGIIELPKNDCNLLSANPRRRRDRRARRRSPPVKTARGRPAIHRRASVRPPALPRRRGASSRCESIW
jgi:polysaccharide export outer membrane protein